MKIAIATGPFLPAPPGRAGAVERLMSDLAARFAAQGHEVSLLSRSFPGAAAEETLQGVRHIRRLEPAGTRSLLLNLLKDLRYSATIARLLPEADLWSLNSFWLPVFARARRRGRRRPVIVVNAHRYPKHQYFLYRGVDRIATVSHAISRAIAAQSPWAAPLIRVFPNPIDTGVFRPPPGPREGTPVITFTGRLHPEKGLAILIRAHRLITGSGRRARLKIIGPWRIGEGGGGEAHLGGLKALADGLDVQFIEAIHDRAALAAELQQSSYYVYPTIAEKGEALPVAPLEAMATGAVPVVSRMDCFASYLVHGETGLMFDFKGGAAAENLAAALMQLMDDPGLSARLSRAAAARAAEFSCERIAGLYLEDFATLLQTSAPAAART